ncbi:hypothetical protein MMC20_001848 [Loxospora ochrophaea]|nr:hypothetical protein [Loxospora ochrophaea]
MDHVPVPQNPVHPPIKIPLYCSGEYTSTSFLQYFDEIGINSDYVISSSKTEDSWDELHALLQKWGYFGLMSEVFGKTIHIDCFFEECTDRERYIMVKLLPKVVSEWIQSSRALGSDEKRLILDYMQKCVSEVHTILLEIYLESGDAVDTRQVLSMAVLIEHLEEAKPLVFHETSLGATKNNVHIRFRSIGIVQGMEFITQRMLSDGRGPHEVWTVSKNASCAHLYLTLLASLKGQDRKRTTLCLDVL